MTGGPTPADVYSLCREPAPTAHLREGLGDGVSEVRLARVLGADNAPCNFVGSPKRATRRETECSRAVWEYGAESARTTGAPVL